MNSLLDFLFSFSRWSSQWNELAILRLLNTFEK